MKLLYYCPNSYGGIADYAHEQANALAKAGVNVYLLTTPNYPSGRGEFYTILPILRELATEPMLRIPAVFSKLLKGLYYCAITYSNIKALIQTIKQQSFLYVLLASYSEYLAPLWANSLERMSQKGVKFGAIIHDPVRDYVVGPTWWHRWSIAKGYSFLHEAFVHNTIELDTVRPMHQLHTTVIPHGPYEFPEPSLSREGMRARLSLSMEAKVMLAFGHLRHNKNLDLVIRAMANVPEVYLVVAGQETSSSKPLITEYQVLAENLGVNDRIRWEVRFIPEDEVSNIFLATDLVLLTYSNSFRSASGVLNTAVQYQKFCLASGGESNLLSSVEHYNLGILVKPDCVESIATGLKKWLISFENKIPSWDDYLNDNSWSRNACLTMQALSRKKNA